MKVNAWPFFPQNLATASLEHVSLSSVTLFAPGLWTRLALNSACLHALNAGIEDEHLHAHLYLSSYIAQASLDPWLSSLSASAMGMGHEAQLISRPLPRPIR